MDNSRANISTTSSKKLQREMVRANPVFKSNTEKILKNINRELPQLPNEEKIEKKLEDEEELLVLYKQVNSNFLSKKDEREGKSNPGQEAEYDQGEAYQPRG